MGERHRYHLRCDSEAKPRQSSTETLEAKPRKLVSELGPGEHGSLRGEFLGARPVFDQIVDPADRRAVEA